MNIFERIYTATYFSFSFSFFFLSLNKAKLFNIISMNAAVTALLEYKGFNFLLG